MTVVLKNKNGARSELVVVKVLKIRNMRYHDAVHHTSMWCSMTCCVASHFIV